MDDILKLLDTDYYMLPEFFNTRPLTTTLIDNKDYPILVPQEVLKYFLSDLSLKDFPAHFCGAGRGIGEKLVPDHLRVFFRKIKISPACLCHDLEYAMAPPTWDAFRASDSRLRTNVSIITSTHTKYNWERWLFDVMAALYLMATDTFGKYIFWEIKREQGHEIPPSARWYIGQDKE